MIAFIFLCQSRVGLDDYPKISSWIKSQLADSAMMVGSVASVLMRARSERETL
jgi:hypothetical protein